MKKTFWIICSVLLVSIMTGTFLLSDIPVLAADQDRTPQQVQTNQLIYGSELMTPQERAEYQVRMRNAGTVEERERIRNEHHESMKERANAQGFKLPDEPLDRGMGRGMGPGGGMGRGGRNR